MSDEFDFEDRRTPPDNASLWRQLVIIQQQVIAHQQAQLDFQKTVNEKLDRIADVLSQAKGGWKVFMAVGGAVTVACSGIAWFFLNVLHIKI